MLLPRILPALGLLALGACQTSPAATSGYLSSYQGIAAPGFSLRAAIQQRRDDAESERLERIHIAPAVLADGAAGTLDQGERDAVLREVDRRICFALSRRFTVVSEAEADAGLVRTVVSRIRPTGRMGSGVSVVAGVFNPVPLTDIRVPGTTGGLAVESELLAPDGRQVAVVTWARDATVVGRESPSMSRIGDAVQLAEPMGGVVARAFATKSREPRPVGDPDPCAAYGPRRNAGRWIGEKAFGFATGLYQPEVSGLARPAPSQRDPSIVVGDPIAVPQ